MNAGDRVEALVECYYWWGSVRKGDLGTVVVDNIHMPTVTVRWDLSTNVGDLSLSEVRRISAPQSLPIGMSHTGVVGANSVGTAYSLVGIYWDPSLITDPASEYKGALFQSVSIRCTCGVDSVGEGRHSTWCDKNEVKS